jgi:hypothetical protein
MGLLAPSSFARRTIRSRPGERPKLLVLSDNPSMPMNKNRLPDPRSIAAEVDLENGRGQHPVRERSGGAHHPDRARPGQRWRIVNATAARVYRLALPGRSLIKVGTDGGLFGAPVEVPEVTLANSGRVELLVRGGGDTSAALQDLPYDRYMPQTRPADWDSTRTILWVRASRAPSVRPVGIPRVLRPIPALDTTHVATRRVIVMSQGQLDGKRMDMQRIDIRARLNTTEIWTIQNVVGMDHPFHLPASRPKCWTATVCRSHTRAGTTPSTCPSTLRCASWCASTTTRGDGCITAIYWITKTKE